MTVPRRALLRSGLLSAAAGALVRGAPLLALAGSTAPESVERVLLVTKCHLDVGFTNTQHKVVQRYFEIYYPQAMQTAATLRRAGGDCYTWTTGSWLLYEYLEQAAPEQRRAMEQAVLAGDIAYHALPFSWQTELLDRGMIEGALGFAAALDRRFGRKTIGAKMTDVPGHTRGIITPLAAAGVRLLDIGVNAASTAPEVPEVFLWKNAAGDSLAMLYHRHDYGSTLRIPGTATAVDVEVRGDNSGPHTPGEIAAIYAKLRAQFPGASIQAANMSDVAAAVDTVRERLPVVESEIGDTWIYGVASDPVKVSRYREMARLREEWIAAGRLQVGDATDRQLLQRLLLAAEHTWGTDTKTYLDTEHYRHDDLLRVLDQPGYKVMQASWREKRADIDEGVAALPAAMQKEALGRLQSLAVTPASRVGMARHDPSAPVETKHFRIAFDPGTGALRSLRHKASGNDWASADHPLALLRYQTLSAEDYASFLKLYLKTEADWAPRDFGKPGIAKLEPLSTMWTPHLKTCWRAKDDRGERVLLELAFADTAAEATGNVAWPAAATLEIRLPDAEQMVELTLTLISKPIIRMPEALWLSFHPIAPDPRGWALQKSGERVSPVDVVRGGGRAMHAVTGEVRYEDPEGRSIRLLSLDAPLVAVGACTPLNFSLDQPSLAEGLHFGLFNNAWGTNYPQWCGGDWRYRFRVKL